MPVLHACATRHGIKRGVEFDRIEVARVFGQERGRPRAGRQKGAGPTGITPTHRADMDVHASLAHWLRVRGFSTSLRASPSRLNDSSSSTAKVAGKNSRCGYRSITRELNPSRIMVPKLGVGGRTP